MGRVAKPTPLKVLHGERRSRINLAEPQPRDVLPDRPAWLSPMAAEEWDRVLPELTAMGTARASDTAGLAGYCEAVARFRVAIAAVADHGLTFTDRDGATRKNPAVAMARDASCELRLWAKEFGLTPAARSPLRVEHHYGLPAERLLT